MCARSVWRDEVGGALMTCLVCWAAGPGPHSRPPPTMVPSSPPGYEASVDYYPAWSTALISHPHFLTPELQRFGAGGRGSLLSHQGTNDSHRRVRAPEQTWSSLGLGFCSLLSVGAPGKSLGVLGPLFPTRP